MNAFSRALLLGLALVLGLTGKSSAYSLEGASWPPGVVLFQLALGNANRTLQDGNTSWDAAVAPALNMWNQQMQRVQTTSLVNGVVPATSGDKLNTVVFSDTVFGQAFGSSTLAITYYRMIGSNMAEADILFNTAQTFDSYRGRLQFGANGHAVVDIQRVFLHETGHALGLGHPDTAGQKVDAVMNSVVSDRATPADDDINGIQYMYGAPLLSASPTPPPSPTPTPSSSPTPTPSPQPTISATPSSSSTSHLANISTRLNVDATSDASLNSNVMIGGFIITGSQPKQVILRALGPSLGAAGIDGAMQDPMLQLHDSSGAVIASDDDWQTGGQRDAIIATGLAPENSRESAIIAALSPGNYTAVLQGAGQTGGIAVVEAYELDSSSTRLVNISTRGHVGLDQQVMIGGFIVQGSTQKKVILRALGPSMNSSNSAVQGVLADPMLELRDSNGALLAENDNWPESPQAAEIIATGIPPSDPHEAAIVADLGAGNFTAIVRGANLTEGVGLVEVYDLDRE